MGLEIFNFRWFFGSTKLFLTIKLLIKLDRPKNKETTHIVLETIISQIILQNFYKIGLNPGELELLEFAIVSLFLTKIASEGFPTSFNFSRSLT